jgi:hypothetical protein
MLDKPLKDRYAVRFLTEPAWENEHMKVRAGVRVIGYEIVDMNLAVVHSSSVSKYLEDNQVIYTTKDLNEADRYCAMLNKQDKIERN